METYEVLSPLANASIGDVVTAEDLAGCQIDALIASGHIAPTNQEQPTEQQPQTEPTAGG